MTIRIALTGATGFVGGHLLKELLSLGFSVNALTRRPQKPIENVHWISGDFENRAALKELISDADVIINVAGAVKAKSRQEFLSANSDAVSALIDEIKLIDNRPHFIQISSLAAREPELSNYAYSKNLGEQIIKDSTFNLDWTIIRPPGIYGPGDIETLKIFKMLKWRFALYPASGKHRVSWIHVSDLAKATAMLIKNKKHLGQTIDIDDGRLKGYSHEEFYNIAAKVMKIKPFEITVPKFLLKTIGHTNDIVGGIFSYAPMLSAKKVNELCHSDWISSKQGNYQIDEWVPEFELEEGLNETLDWYKRNEYI